MKAYVVLSGNEDTCYAPGVITTDLFEYITCSEDAAKNKVQELAKKYSDKEGFEIKVVHGDSIIPDGALFVEGACFDKWFYYIEEEI
jgi:hypothetical protein